MIKRPMLTLITNVPDDSRTTPEQAETTYPGTCGNEALVYVPVLFTVIYVGKGLKVQIIYMSV